MKKTYFTSLLNLHFMPDTRNDMNTNKGKLLDNSKDNRFISFVITNCLLESTQLMLSLRCCT